MLDQAFTSENFRYILDRENRKGLYLEGRFFPKVAKIWEKVVETRAQIKENQKGLKIAPSPALKAKVERLKNKAIDLEEKYEEALTSTLEELAKKISRKTFVVTLKQSIRPGSKTVYSVPDDPTTFFVEKQVQSNLHRTFLIKQANRHHIISQIKTLLDDRFPKIVIRTDISDFYESIDQNRLKNLLHRNSLFSEPSKKFIAAALRSFNGYTGKQIGVPRGIGISAYLAELYMREFDEEVQRIDDLVYYARYVDDVILILAPTATSKPSEYRDKIDNLAKSIHLSLNPAKTSVIDALGDQERTFAYLGYGFSFGKSSVQVALSSSKINRHKKRIELCFIEYVQRSKLNEKIARKQLIKRVRFLTSNTRLHNNKSNALVGIYFTQPHIDDLSCLKALDAYLKTEINKNTSGQLRNRLHKFSFIKGFSERSFCSFSPVELENIVRVWKNVT